MLTLYKIAVTGPISSGKSTVCELLSKQGAFVLSADQVVHDLLEHDKLVQNQVTNLLKVDINFESPSYRKQIADLVFNDFNMLQKIEAILHPIVFAYIEAKYEQLKKSSSTKLFVCEIPLLYEAAMDAFFDKVICVIADKTLCLKRFIEKTGLNEQEWNNRMKRFAPLESKLENSSYVILNNGSKYQLESQVNQFLTTLL